MKLIIRNYLGNFYFMNVAPWLKVQQALSKTWDLYIFYLTK